MTWASFFIFVAEGGFSAGAMLGEFCGGLSIA